MYKKIIIVFVICLCAYITPVSAHLTGAFAEFLAVVYDKETLSDLQQQLEETKQQIEQLTPQIEQAEQAFQRSQQQAITQLQLFSEFGLDTALAMLQQGDDVVDMMGSKWLMTYQIDQYLNDLNALYLQFKQLQLTQQTMQGHTELLQAIETNLQARETYLQAAQGLDLETIANYLDIDWTSEVEYHLLDDLAADQQLIETQLADWLQATANNTQLHEQWLNERSNARYYFRQDHIYIEYKINAEHVLLLGQVLQTDETHAQVQIEAGFYNGFFLPNELLEELQGFTINLGDVATISQITQPFIVQKNGSLQIQGQ